ncbi:hypothetical protein QAD02_000411 [Eretmocerus hayati]|uniref:Uncharacterized protein n=1 Tax=Eretmocerus hayati TaxID=131215 RepID=A0ACC2NDC4_9HYME|nr:hypothetical protein QAD02_000411 [Eretmocerus hayati]
MRKANENYCLASHTYLGVLGQPQQQISIRVLKTIRFWNKLKRCHDKVTDNLDPSNLEYSGEDSSDDDYEPPDDGANYVSLDNNLGKSQHTTSTNKPEKVNSVAAGPSRSPSSHAKHHVRSFDTTNRSNDQNAEQCQQQLNSTRLEQECDQIGTRISASLSDADSDTSSDEDLSTDEEGWPSREFLDEDVPATDLPVTAEGNDNQHELKLAVSFFCSSTHKNQFVESSQTVNKLSESNSPKEASVREETISIDGHPSNSSLSTPPHATSTSIDHEECLNGGSTAQHGQDSILCEIGATGTADTNDERFYNFSSSTLIDADQEMEIQGNKIEQSPVAEHPILNEEDTLSNASESEAEERTNQKLTKKQRPPSPKITCPVAESRQQESFEARK